MAYNAAYDTALMALGPVAYWKLGEATAAMACADSSGNGHNLTYTAGATFGVPGLLAGESATCVTQAAGVNVAQVMPPVAGINDVFTLVAWIRPGTVTGLQAIVSFDVGGPVLRLNSAQLDALASTVADIANSGATTLVAGQTYMVAWTKNGATNHLYLNGVDVTNLLANHTCATNTTSAYATSIGSDVHGTSSQGSLTVEKAAAFNYALSAAQITSLYNAGTTYAPPAPGSFPVPAGRGRWRLTLHTRTFARWTAPTWDQTIVAELVNARGRRLDQQWDNPAQLAFTVDGHDPQAALIAELQHDVCAWRWDDQTGADVCVFRGVIDHSEDQISEQTHTVTFTCHDYLAVIGRRFLLGAPPLTYTAQDQDYLAGYAVNNAGGDYLGYVPGGYIPTMIVTVDPTGAARGLSGVLRDRTYPGGTNWGQALDDLAKVLGGFDYDLIPEPQAADTLPGFDSRNVYPTALGAGRDAVRLFYPRQGVTRTDMALVYGSTVSALTRTVSSADYANLARVLGNNGSAAPATAQLISTASNADATGTTVGFWPFAENAADVSTQATLDQKAAGDLAYYGTLLPTYTLTLRPGAYSWGNPRMGDTVALVVASGRLNVTTSVRVVAIGYAIGDDGQEDVTLTVGRPPTSLGDLLQATQADVNALARR